MEGHILLLFVPSGQTQPLLSMSTTTRLCFFFKIQKSYQAELPKSFFLTGTKCPVCHKHHNVFLSSRSALLLNSVMRAFRPEFVAARATDFIGMIKESDEAGFPKVRGHERS